MAERKTKAAEAGKDAGDDGTGASAAVASTEAAPLDAPQPKPRRLGNPDSSTDFVAANAALMLPPGARHLRLHDFEGGDVDPESLFEFPAAESPSHLATVRQQVFREFLHREASTPTSQLFYPAGAQVPVQQALKVRDALRAVAEEPDPEPHTSVV